MRAKIKKDMDEVEMFSYVRALELFIALVSEIVRAQLSRQLGDRRPERRLRYRLIERRRYGKGGRYGKES